MTRPTFAQMSMSSEPSQPVQPSRGNASTDAPTVWVPLLAVQEAINGQRPHSGSGRNTLALIALMASLVFPVATTINVLGIVAVANHLIPQRALIAFVAIGGGLGTLSIPAMLTAVIGGHVALVLAKRYPRSGARRWMAIVALVLGYLSLLAFISVIGLFLLPMGTKIQIF